MRKVTILLVTLIIVSLLAGNVLAADLTWTVSPGWTVPVGTGFGLVFNKFGVYCKLTAGGHDGEITLTNTNGLVVLANDVGTGTITCSKDGQTLSHEYTFTGTPTGNGFSCTLQAGSGLELNNALNTDPGRRVIVQQSKDRILVYNIEDGGQGQIEMKVKISGDDFGKDQNQILGQASFLTVDGQYGATVTVSTLGNQGDNWVVQINISTDNEVVYQSTVDHDTLQLGKLTLSS